MSLEKSIMYGKDHRKKYYGSKAFARGCRCHGACPWCCGNRRYSAEKKKLAVQQRMDLLKKDEQ